MVKTIKGFERNPFTKQHRIKVGYYFATNGFDLRYNGEYNVSGEWNLHVGGVFTTENFTNNFFGIGNETSNNDNDLGLDYNRVKMSIYALKFGLMKKSDFGSDFGVRMLFEGINIDDTTDRFITNFVNETNSSFYERRYFGALEGEFLYNSFDDKINPTRGMTFLIDLGTKTELEKTENTHGYLNSNLGFYNALSNNRKLVLKSEVSTQLRIGDEIPFYQLASIGGQNGLRGYRTQRFTGKNSFIGSGDLRYSFNSFKTKTLPLQIGIFGGYDVGRVWVKNEESNSWHNSYGGGFWIAAAESISGTFNLFNSNDGPRFSFGFGLNF